MFIRAVLVMAAVLTPAVSAAQAPAATEFRPVKVAEAPLIDGSLDDEAWRQTPMPTGQWLSYNPLHGDNIPQQTTVWITYDANYMYIAFKCDDPEPARIRTSITRRDNAWPDDWVGLSLDALGTGQLAYHMMVNPSGVQMDMLQTVAGGEDQSVDWVWDSAGRLTETGYAVEIRLPLQSIRFRGGDNMKMGVLFWRRVSRIGVSVSWPAMQPGRWVFENHAPLIFPDIQPRLPKQVIPSTTYARSQSRDTPSSWGKADGVGDFGVTTKLGLTPTVTLDATVNPDFSQVESDSFQVQVNQRFPVFFSERRPFFMEGAGIFSLAGQGDDNSLLYAVHTRRIVDPIFGAKLTGSMGRVTFATLSAVDQQPGRSLEADDPLHPDAGRERVFNIARAQYSLGPSNYAGAIVADTEFAGGHNRVIGSDLAYRLTKNQRISGFVLGSQSRAPHAADSKAGVAGVVSYAYNTMPLMIPGAVEHYDRNFQMDTAFINRVGMTSGWGFVERNFYPDKNEVSVAPSGLGLHVHPGRTRSHRWRRRSDRAARRPLQLHAAGIPTRRSIVRVRALGESPVRSRTMAHPRRSPTLPLAQRGRGIRSRARGVLRCARSVPGPLARFASRRHAAAERTVLAEPGIPARGVRSRVHRRTRLHPGHREQPDDVSIHAQLLPARAGAIRQLAQPGAHRLPLLLRAPPRHGRLRRLRVADRAARVRGRPLDRQ